MKRRIYLPPLPLPGLSRQRWYRDGDVVWFESLHRPAGEGTLLKAECVAAGGLLWARTLIHEEVHHFLVEWRQGL